jgi:hypothetical protein
MTGMNELIRIFSERGDLAHLALLLWAGSASALLYGLLRALSVGMGRIDDFVREMARFNQRHGGRNGDVAQGDAPDPRRDQIAPGPLERVPRIPRSSRPRRQARQAGARRAARQGKEQA